MNIGIVTTWLERGAAYVSRQFRDVLSQEHNVFIYARGGEAAAKGDPRWDTPEVTWEKRKLDSSSAVILTRFRRWIESNELDIVIFNEQKEWDAVLLCNELGVINGAYIDYYTEQTIPLFGAHDFLVCNTRRHLSAFSWHPQALYIPWGTDTSLFQPRQSGLVRPGAVTFFHSAGLSPGRKGTDLVLRAFAAAEPPGTRLVIHAQCSLKKALPKLNTLIDDLQGRDLLELIEETVPAPGLYHTGDIYVYPSRLEGIGLTVAEALSCGLPAIVPDWPPMNEFVTPDSGWTVPVDRLHCRADGYYWPVNEVNVEKLAERMGEVSRHPRVVERMKQSARDHALENLDWADNAQLLLKKIPQVERISPDQKREYEMLAREYHDMLRYRIRRLLYRTPILRTVANLIQRRKLVW